MVPVGWWAFWRGSRGFETGAVSRLPSEVVQEGFFIPYDTNCLERSRKLQRSATDEEDDSAPLSFKLTSELLIVRRCFPFREILIRVGKSGKKLLPLARAKVALGEADATPATAACSRLTWYRVPIQSANRSGQLQILLSSIP